MNTFSKPQAPQRPSHNVPPEFTEALAVLERQLDALAGDLLSGDAVAFEAHCAGLPQQCLRLSQAYKALPPALAANRTLKRRVVMTGERLAMQRENMARRVGGVDRELQVLLPARQGATYGRAAGGYGQAARSPGSFASLRA